MQKSFTIISSAHRCRVSNFIVSQSCKSKDDSGFCFRHIFVLSRLCLTVWLSDCYCPDLGTGAWKAGQSQARVLGDMNLHGADFCWVHYMAHPSSHSSEILPRWTWRFMKILKIVPRIGIGVVWERMHTPVHDIPWMETHPFIYSSSSLNSPCKTQCDWRNTRVWIVLKTNLDSGLVGSQYSCLHTKAVALHVTFPYLQHLIDRCQHGDFTLQVILKCLLL